MHAISVKIFLTNESVILQPTLILNSLIGCILSYRRIGKKYVMILFLKIIFDFMKMMYVCGTDATNIKPAANERLDKRLFKI